jgi:DNA-binding NtrC family response regulator
LILALTAPSSNSSSRSRARRLELKRGDPIPAALLIDDEPDVRESLQQAAKANGVDLEVAAGWDEGIALFHALSPDLVIADYNLPGSRHGLKLLATVKRRRPSVRLILISGYLDEGDMDAVAELGIVDRALVKGGIATTRELLAEIKQAAEQASLATDWVRVAEAHVESEQVSDDALSALDEKLASSAGGRGAPEGG